MTCRCPIEPSGTCRRICSDESLSRPCVSTSLAPLFPATRTQTSGTHQQPAFAHHPQHPFAIHRQTFLPLQPPRHTPIAISQLLSAGHDDLLVIGAVGPAASRLLLVIQARPADGQRSGHQRSSVALRHQFACLGVNGTAAHSPTTFFRISISSDFRPSVRSSCLDAAVFLGFGGGSASPPKRCLRSFFCFIPPPIQQ